MDPVWPCYAISRTRERGVNSPPISREDMAISKKRLMATPATAYRDRVWQCVQAPGLFMKEDATGSSRAGIMTATNKRFAIVTNTKGIGVTRATQQPVTFGPAGRADHT